MEITGIITSVLPMFDGVSQRTGKTWQKQEFVLETYDRFPKKIFMAVFGESVSNYNIMVGQSVKVSFDLESRSYIGRDGVERWSTDVRVWKIEDFVQPQQGYAMPQAAAPIAAPQAPIQQPYAQPAQQPVYAPQTQVQQPAAPAHSEDLPF